jgi:DNA protecting protein DprA
MPSSKRDTRQPRGESGRRTPAASKLPSADALGIERAARDEEARVTADVIEKVGVGIDELTALMMLEAVKGFGPQKFKELYAVEVTPIDVLEDPSRLPTKGKRGDQFRREIATLSHQQGGVARRRAVRQIIRAFETDARILTYRSDLYPRHVLESNNPVPLLYARGSLEILQRERIVACVGSRDIHPPYNAQHRGFCEFAVRQGFVIGSGFATGADRIGHEAAYESGGETILVMPCGLDRPFPPENKDLWRQLLEYQGAVMVSEFHFGTKAAALTLRKRNKLIVAFALGVLISQSSVKGGAMNAYRFALEQRKPAATFAADGSEQTGGNVAIANGPIKRRGASMAPRDELFGRNDLAPTTVFPLDSSGQHDWRIWLRELSS